MPPIDSTDARLLNLLQQDSSQSLATLGRQVGLSVSAVNERLKKLRARGDVRAYVALIDPQTVGYSTCAFVRVAVEGQRDERDFVESVLKMPEIEECHRISGEFPVLLKMWAHDLQHLERLLDGTIRTHSGVRRTEVSVVLSSPKDHVTGLTLGFEIS